MYFFRLEEEARVALLRLDEEGLCESQTFSWFGSGFNDKEIVKKSFILAVKDQLRYFVQHDSGRPRSLDVINSTVEDVRESICGSIEGLFKAKDRFWPPSVDIGTGGKPDFPFSMGNVVSDCGIQMVIDEAAKFYGSQNNWQKLFSGIDGAVDLLFIVLTSFYLRKKITLYLVENRSLKKVEIMVHAFKKQSCSEIKLGLISVDGENFFSSITQKGLFENR